MSFKSKQRAKHGHLFGDDPLNATATTTSLKSPDPVSSRKSQSKSPLDPLSRSSSPGSSSTSSTGSIFGGIDVSKFGNKRNNLRSSTSLRPSASLKLIDDDDDSTHHIDDNDDDDDDDFLFGGKRKTTSNLATRKSTSTSPRIANQSTSSPRLSQSTLIPIQPTSQSSSGTQPQQTSQVSSPPLPPPRVNSSSSLNSQSSSQPKHSDTPKKQPPPLPPARRPASISSRTPISSLVSSSTSSLSSFPSSTSSSPILGNPQQSSASIPPPPPPRVHKKHQQQDLLRQIESSVEYNNNNNDDDDEETRNLQRQKAAMMEDEATRAFAMESSVLSPSTMLMNYDDDPELYASVTQFHSLAITGSSSTPTSKRNVTSIPRSNPMISSNNNNSSNPWDNTAAFLTPTMSTPFPTSNHTKQDLEKNWKEIEPAKRAAFADLIENWHSSKNAAHENGCNDDEDDFLKYVASEQRDIGFAGIDDGLKDDHSRVSSFGWRQDMLDENPWS
ncbi:uncharacterized protein BX664DRAFT_384139 [Halteromyces radiatus]|uniref:uncharacterized protein n=1 Tax=Halteromyces radiatus TaxID=101107 RepID=UPI00222100C1|nr:uncharacterized protein BX664DRAFT_384139 [Halteromyces radiatus]KAI8092593.1 hypothetical protein BX664DRAFT_384139 [Halteromyces radiatus]